MLNLEGSARVFPFCVEKKQSIVEFQEKYFFKILYKNVYSSTETFFSLKLLSRDYIPHPMDKREKMYFYINKNKIFYLWTYKTRRSRNKCSLGNNLCFKTASLTPLIHLKYFSSYVFRRQLLKLLNSELEYNKGCITVW